MTNILDLSNMGATHERDGRKYMIIKWDNDEAPYAVLNVLKNNQLSWERWICKGDLSYYTPLPNAPQWVTLTTVTGEKVQIEWKPNYVLSNNPNHHRLIMVIMPLFKEHPIMVNQDNEVYLGCSLSNYTPIAPNPLEFMGFKIVEDDTLPKNEFHVVSNGKKYRFVMDTASPLDEARRELDSLINDRSPKLPILTETILRLKKIKSLLDKEVNDEQTR